MAGVKISALPAVTSALLTDIFPVVQAGVTSKETIQQVLTLFSISSNVITWNDQASASVTMVAGNGYIIDNGAGLVTLTLPATSARGTELHIQGFSSGGWTIAQGAGQSIQIGAATSTVGVGGSVASSAASNSVRLICVTANTKWANCGAPQGILTVT